MPNWVRSTFSINGDKENLEKIADRILVTEEYLEHLKKRNENLDEAFKITPREPGSLSFDRLIPVPTDIFQKNIGKEEDEKYGDKTWYSWNIRHWGTKWDACEVNACASDNFIEITFETAWSFPKPYMDVLAELVAEHGCYMYGEFADEDFGGHMGDFDTDDAGLLHVKWYDQDVTIYDHVWGVEIY